MKPVRFITVLVAVGLFVTAFGPIQRSNIVAQKSKPSSSALAQGFNTAALDLSLNSPLTFLVGASAVNIVAESAPSAAGYYGCSLVSQTPADWTRMGKRQYFDTRWTVKNTGTKNWGIHDVDFAYVSGKVMHTHAYIYDLYANTAPGKKITLSVDMVAPKPLGYYTEYWGLYVGKSIFCRLSVTIVVNH